MRKYIVTVASYDNPPKYKDSVFVARSAAEAALMAEKGSINPYREHVIASYPFVFKEI